MFAAKLTRVDVENAALLRKKTHVIGFLLIIMGVTEPYTKVSRRSDWRDYPLTARHTPLAKMYSQWQVPRYEPYKRVTNSRHPLVHYTQRVY